MNQARQIRAGTCDTKDAHINAEKTKEAWPSSRTWRLDTPSSSTEEKNWFLCATDFGFTHKIGRIPAYFYKCGNILHQTTLYEDYFHFLHNKKMTIN